MSAVKKARKGVLREEEAVRWVLSQGFESGALGTRTDSLANERLNKSLFGTPATARCTSCPLPRAPHPTRTVPNPLKNHGVPCTAGLELVSNS